MDSAVRAEVVRLLLGGRTTRVDIASITGVSRQTVWHIEKELRRTYQ